MEIGSGPGLAGIIAGGDDAAPPLLRMHAPAEPTYHGLPLSVVWQCMAAEALVSRVAHVFEIEMLLVVQILGQAPPELFNLMIESVEGWETMGQFVAAQLGRPPKDRIVRVH